MTENNQTTAETPPSGSGQSGEIVTELRELGQNLRTLLQTAWESAERKKLQTEIETGLNDLFSNLKQATKDYNESPSGQALKSDLEDLGQRIRSGELETKVRNEVLNALRAANTGLKESTTSKPAAPSDEGR